jgi:two-component system phosphate regulon sensor histidine kinase PhoR
MPSEEKKEIEELKLDLLVLTSHQLKTPMGIIRGYATLLREGFYGPLSSEVKEILSKIEFGTEEVIMLVDNIIELRKVEDGRVYYQKEHADFMAIARQASEEMGHMAMSCGLNLDFSGPDHEIMVYGDVQKLRHIVQNLIDNAVKYTKKGSISVKVEEKKNDVVLSVADTGIGISAKVIPKLFQQFFRDEHVVQDIKGTGMGLYIARIFMEAHGGKIWVESDGEGKGSTFYISLPKE